MEDKSSGKDENGKPLKKVIIDVDESKGGKPKLYITLESSNAPISHNAMGQEVRRESKREYWLETFEIDIQNKQTRTAGHGADYYLTQPIAKMSEQVRKNVIKYNYDDTSLTDRPEGIRKATSNINDARVHGDGYKLYGKGKGPNGGASFPELFNSSMKPSTIDIPTSTNSNPHVLLPYIGVSGGLPMKANQDIIRKLIRNNNCKNGEEPGRCSGGMK